MTRISMLTFTLTCLTANLFAGALSLVVGNPGANQEVQSKNGVALVEVTACRSPGKTMVRASAIGEVDGKQQVIPLTVIALSKPGLYTVAREWPESGSWVIKFVATNSDYGSYATGALIPVKGRMVEWARAKNYFHEPDAHDVGSLLE